MTPDADPALFPACCTYRTHGAREDTGRERRRPHHARQGRRQTNPRVSEGRPRMTLQTRPKALALYCGAFGEQALELLTRERPA